MKSDGWFDVDREGLRSLVAGREKAHVIAELVQNAWDEASKRVIVMLAPTSERGIAKLTVSDDNPEGFADLRDAFTLFKDSQKKTDATKRGRFNLGEKIVLALCTEAEIKTTKGTVRFERRSNRSSEAGFARRVRPPW